METETKTTNKDQEKHKSAPARHPSKWLGAACLLFGVWAAATSGLFVRSSDVGAAALGAYRAALGLPLFFIFYACVLKKRPQAPGKALKFLIVTGVGGVLFAPLYHMSYRYTTITNAELIVNMIPFVIIPMSWLLYRERITVGFFFALLVAFAGLVTLMSGKLEASQETLFGDMLAGIACIGFAGYIMLLAKIRTTLSGIDTMFYVQIAFSVMLFPVAIIAGEQVLPGSWASFASLLSLSWFTNLVGQGCIVIGLGLVNTNLASVFIMSQPVAGAVYGAVFLGERLTGMEYLGIAICLTGIALVQFVSARSK